MVGYIIISFIIYFINKNDLFFYEKFNRTSYELMYIRNIIC